MDALVSELKAVITQAGADIQVHDGPFIGGGSAPNAIVVGWPGFTPGYEYPSRSMSEETGNAAVAGENSQTGLAPALLETFTISCASLVRSGSTSPLDISTGRRTAYQNLKYIGQILQGPQWLLGTVKRATMGTSVSYFPVLDRRGLLNVVTFGIRCEGWSQQ